ncbi:hypothetical protein BRDID11002_15790 [Bradyrhizobium diazoefficiens]
MLHDEDIRQAVHVDKGIRVLFRDDISALGTEPIEIEANAFASELLIPGDLLAAVLEGGGVDLEDEAAIEGLARRFRVSPAAMRFRLTRW